MGLWARWTTIKPWILTTSESIYLVHERGQVLVNITHLDHDAQQELLRESIIREGHEV